MNIGGGEGGGDIIDGFSYRSPEQGSIIALKAYVLHPSQQPMAAAVFGLAIKIHSVVKLHELRLSYEVKLF